MNYKNIVKGFAALSLTAVLGVPSVHAASGTTTVDVTFPPLIILYYFSAITVDVSESDLETLISNANAGCNVSTDDVAGASELDCQASVTPTLSTPSSLVTTTISYDANIAADANVSPAVDGTITVVLENSWAVRALTSSTLTASVALGGGDFEAGSEVISPTAPDASLTLGGANNNIGDVQFDIDLTTITPPTASDSVTITVISP